MISIPAILDRKLGYTKSKLSHDTFQMSVHIHGYVSFGTVRNAIEFSVHAKSITSLDMILPILSSANQSVFQSISLSRKAHINSLTPSTF